MLNWYDSYERHFGTIQITNVFVLWPSNTTLGIYLSDILQSLSRVRLFATPWTVAHQTSLFITNSQSLLKSCLSSQWCHPAISSSVVSFSSHLQSFPASGSFPMSQFFASGGHSVGVSAILTPRIYLPRWKTPSILACSLQHCLK